MPLAVYLLPTGAAAKIMNDRIKRHRVGEVSSKYGYQPEKFDEDIMRRADASQKLWENFLAWAHDHNLTPDDCRRLLIRLYDEFI